MNQTTQVPCPVEEMTETQRYRLLEDVIHQYEGKESNLIQILHYGHSIFGFLSPETQRFIALKTGLPLSRVSGVVTFYTFFSTQPKGRHTISVCLGTACYVRGGRKIIEKLQDLLGIDMGETTEDFRFSLEVKRCIGACGLAPAVSIDGTVYKRVNPRRLEQILSTYR